MFGVALLAAGIGSLQYMLDEGERNGWFDDGRIVWAAAVAVAGLVAFAAWELYGARTPGVALRTFRHRSVWALSVINFAVAAGIFALVFIQPQWAQTSLGFTTTLAGLLLISARRNAGAALPRHHVGYIASALGLALGRRRRNVRRRPRDLAADRHHDDRHVVRRARRDAMLAALATPSSSCR